MSIKTLYDRGRALRDNAMSYFRAKGLNTQDKGHNVYPIFIIDTETTGLDAQNDEIIDICILPINFDGTINKHHKPLNVYIKPTRPEQDPKWPSFMKRNFARAKELGVTKKEFMDYFLDWTNRNAVEKIGPAGHNYAGFDALFLKNLFKTAYSSFFDYHVYDTMCMANMMNMVHMQTQKEPLFSSVSLNKVALTLGILPDPMLEHTAYGDCITTQKVLASLLKKTKVEALSAS